MPDSPPHPNRVSAIWVIGALGLAFILGLLYREATRPEPLIMEVLPPPPTATAAPTMTPPPILVHIVCAGDAGPINDTFSLPARTRVEDALLTAGCALESGDTSRVNRAALLRDGDQIYLPAAGAAPAPTPLRPELLRINQANQEELEQLPGIGPTLAARILEWRETQGPFTDLAALDAVPGIGPSMLERLRDLIAFD
ncbi:MAG: ComEA family DNA-binding protein [Chloroflexi bacterium]|nr:ComEA family DNA-binding protein [Chloroflexota bacterium]